MLLAGAVWSPWCQCDYLSTHLQASIVLCRLVVRVHCQPHCTKQYSVVQCRVFSPQSMDIPIVWCVVYIHFAACSLTTNLQSTIVLLAGAVCGASVTIYPHTYKPVVLLAGAVCGASVTIYPHSYKPVVLLAGAVCGASVTIYPHSYKPVVLLAGAVCDASVTIYPHSYKPALA